MTTFALTSIPVVDSIQSLRTPKTSPSGQLRQIMKLSGAAPTTWLEQETDVLIKAATDSGWISSKGAHIPDDADNADIAIIIGAARGDNRKAFWVTADTINWIREHRLDGKISAEDAENIAKAFNIERKTALNRATAGKAFPEDKRPEEVFPSVFGKLASITDENLRFALLQQAASEGWTVQKADQMVKDFLTMGAKADAEGNISTPDIAVLPAEGDAVVQGNVSVSASGLAANVPVCIDKIVEDFVNDGGSASALRGVLQRYCEAGMVKFPPRAWLAGDKTGDTVMAAPAKKQRTNGNGKVAPAPTYKIVTASDTDDADDDSDLPF